MNNALIFVLMITGNSGSYGRAIDTSLWFSDKAACEATAQFIERESDNKKGFPTTKAMCIPIPPKTIYPR